MFWTSNFGPGFVQKSDKIRQIDRTRTKSSKEGRSDKGVLVDSGVILRSVPAEYGRVEGARSPHNHSRGTRSSRSPKELIMILYYILHKLFGAARFEDGE